MAEFNLSESSKRLPDAHLRQISFCVFQRTEQKLKEGSYAKLLSGFFSNQEILQYQSLSDLLFCELFLEWKTPCLNFYSGRGGRLFSFAQVSPTLLLEWDRFLADTVLLRLKELYLKGRRRWPSVIRELRLPTPPKKSNIAAKQQSAVLPRSMLMNRSCSEALEMARLRGVLFRHIHELVESARFDDAQWLNRSMFNIKRFIESLPSSSFGTQLASKILRERLNYVRSLPQYSGVRLRLLTLLEEHSYDQAHFQMSSATLPTSRSLKINQIH